MLVAQKPVERVQGWKEALSSSLPGGWGGGACPSQSALHNQLSTSSHDWDAVAETPQGLSISAHGAELSLDPSLRAVLKQALFKAQLSLTSLNFSTFSAETK